MKTYQETNQEATPCRIFAGFLRIKISCFDCAWYDEIVVLMNVRYNLS